MEKEQDRRYERLYDELLGKLVRFHERNKKRIKIGSIGLVVLPFALELIRRLTDSDKVLFLIVWIICMFALCAYLIGVEYLDYTIKNTVQEMLRKEGLDEDPVYGDLMVDQETLWKAVRARIRKEDEDETHTSDSIL